MSTVANIFQRKKQHLITVAPGTTVVDALQMMADHNIGSVVVAEDGEYKGIMTERDYARKVILKGRRSSEVKVSDIMSTDLPRVKPEDTIEFCMGVMSDKNIRYLPVFTGGKLIGVISILDLIDETVVHQRETITHLRDYIAGYA